MWRLLQDLQVVALKSIVRRDACVPSLTVVEKRLDFWSVFMYSKSLPDTVIMQYLS